VLRILFVLSFIFFSVFKVVAEAKSDGAQTSEKLDQLGATPTNSIPGADQIDNLITNKNLRALSGSTSRWSIASQFNYNGGNLQSPLAEDRPNIADASGTTTKADLDGALWVKYNLDLNNSLMAGFGIRWIAPLAKGGPTNYDGTTFDAINPEIQYQRIYKFLGVQAVLQASLMQWTQADQTAHGYGQQLNVDQENMYEFGETGLSIGASTWAQYQLFNKTGSFGNPTNSDDFIPDLAAIQSVYAINISPILEFEITEKIIFRTVLGLWQYEHYRSENSAFNFSRDKVYQSVGVGFSVTRDIFLNPNIQFLPDDIRDTATNVGLGATINMF